MRHEVFIGIGDELNPFPMKTSIFLFAVVAIAPLKVSSPAFGNGDFIPDEYTCTGSNVNPHLEINGVPSSAQSLALIMDDPDAPNGTFVHWVMWNIPVNGKISRNFVPGTVGVNSKGENKYTGPCPPTGIHHYHFKFYGLDTKLSIPETSDKTALLIAMQGHIVGEGELIGLYRKEK
jgi:Raf kinase inhibitor-like YbhB/YbcL family protein